MNILALEFSSPQRSAAVVALAGGDHKVLSLISEIHGKKSGMALVDDALRQSGLRPEQIEMIGVGLGPGSYAGIRSALAIAQGWQLARGIPVVGVSSVEILAADALAAGFAGKITAIVDAQRGEVYRADYLLADNRARESGALRIAPVSSLAETDLTVGPEAFKFSKSGKILFPSALTLGRLSATRAPVPAEKLEPIYLREAAFVKAPPPRNY